MYIFCKYKPRQREVTQYYNCVMLPFIKHNGSSNELLKLISPKLEFSAPLQAWFSILIYSRV